MVKLNADQSIGGAKGFVNAPSSGQDATLGTHLVRFSQASAMISEAISASSYVHKQETPALNWIINHNLRAIPSVKLVFLTGEVFWGEVQNEIEEDVCNTTNVNLEVAASGYAILNI
ncbi:hypothetical protein D9M68_949700 [compost metagenome]